MVNLIVNASIVAKIQHHHAGVSAAMTSVIWHAIEAGGLLAAVKAQLPYGAFGEWVERECGFKYRTGRKYLLAHKRLAHLPEAEWPSTAILDKAISVPSSKRSKLIRMTNRPIWLPAVGRAVEFADGLGRTWSAWATRGIDHFGVEAEFMTAMVVNLTDDGEEPADFMTRGVRCDFMVAAIGDILTNTLIKYGLEDPASVEWHEIDADLPISLHAELCRLDRLFERPKDNVKSSHETQGAERRGAQ